MPSPLPGLNPSLEQAEVVRSGYVGAFGLDVHGIERLARGHEQAVLLRPAKTDIAADLRQTDQANAIAIWCEHVDTVIAVADPARSSPDIAILVAAETIIRADLAMSGSG